MANYCCFSASQRLSYPKFHSATITLLTSDLTRLFISTTLTAVIPLKSYHLTGLTRGVSVMLCTAHSQSAYTSLLELGTDFPCLSIFSILVIKVQQQRVVPVPVSVSDALILDFGSRSQSSSGKGRSLEGIKFGFSLVKGKANHPMEDYHVAKFTQIQEHELGLFAIYDGHLGDNVPAYLQKHLFSNILKEGEFWVDPHRSISKAYERTDQAILSNSADLGRGDVPRVNGQLAVSRAFGDKSLKLHLRSDPDIENITLDATTELLILASDGLWKVVSNQEAVHIARRSKDPEKAAKLLTAEALARESKDDISCIVVRFR
ncbi:hypothetical protein ACFE04_016114 [Oxalis oulophora]